MGNVYFKFWVWYMGSGMFLGVLGDFWVFIMNFNLGGGNYVVNKVEV